MISSVPPPIGPRRASRSARSSSGGASSAVDLQAGVDHVERGALRAQLGHRHLAHGVLRRPT